MPDMNDFHAYKSTGGETSGGGGGRGFGCGWIVIVIVAILLFVCIAEGESWDTIDSLLSIGLLAFLYFRWIST